MIKRFGLICVLVVGGALTCSYMNPRPAPPNPAPAAEKIEEFDPVEFLGENLPKTPVSRTDINWVIGESAVHNHQK